MIKLKKSQSEIVGFVLIILIVTIMGLVFLSFMIGRGEPSKQESIEISNLLGASMYYTSDCAVSFIPQYKSGQDLIKSCWNSERCLDSRLACDALSSTMKIIIDKSLAVDENKPIKAYKLNIYYKDSLGDSPNEQILNMSDGKFSNCSSKSGGIHSIDISGLNPGLINVELEVCGN